MQCLLEAVIGRPAVPHQHPGEVGAENRRRIVKPPPVADGVDGCLRRGERPQPIQQRAHPPTGLVRRDHRTATDLLAKRCIGRLGRASGTVQQVHQTARGHRQAELRLDDAGRLRQRHPQLGVQLDTQRRDVRTQLHAGRPQCVRGLQPVPALHPSPTLRAVPSLDVEPPYEWTNHGQVFLILTCRTGHLDHTAAVGTGARQRRCMRLVDPCRLLAASVLPVRRAASSSRSPAAALPTVLGEGAACRRPARRAASSSFSRCSLRRFQWSRSSTSFALSRSRRSMRYVPRVSLTHAVRANHRGRASSVPCTLYRHYRHLPAASAQARGRSVRQDRAKQRRPHLDQEPRPPRLQTGPTSRAQRDSSAPDSCRWHRKYGRVLSHREKDSHSLAETILALRITMEHRGEGSPVPWNPQLLANLSHAATRVSQQHSCVTNQPR